MVTPSQYATGIKSQVKSEGEFVSKDVTVGLDSDYTYNVTLSNNQPAGNIVIYDVLVNSLNGQSYDWNGDFKSVDISSLTSDELVSEADIPFTIDIEGITHVNGEAVNYVKMVDEPAIKIIFHENKPGGTIDERNKEFRIYEPKDLVNDKVTHFYDIPEWAGDEYVFAGWYCSNKTSSSNH